MGSWGKSWMFGGSRKKWKFLSLGHRSECGSINLKNVEARDGQHLVIWHNHRC